MRRDRRTSSRPASALRLALGTALSLCVLGACGSSGKATLPAQPATIESLPPSSSMRVHLTADAAHRIDLQTATVKQQVVAGRPQLAAVGAAATATATTATATTAATPTTAAAATATPTTAVARAPGDTEPPKNGTTVPTAATAATAPTAPPTTAPPPPTTAAPTPRLTVPAAAVLYRPTGEAFVYVVAGALEYQRQPVAVDYVVGDLAVLTSGPAPNTLVVTVGAAELLGAELGVGGQELG